MGCVGSKLDPNGETVPPKIRPLLHRRFEQIKKRRHSISLKGQTPSKKELLKDSVEEDDHAPLHSLPDNKSMSARDGSMKSAKVASAPEVDESTRDEAKDVINQQQKRAKQKNEYNNKEEEERVEEKVIKVVAEATREMVLEDKIAEGGDLDSEKDKGRLSNFDDRLLCPGSPSFRVYCIDSFENDKDKGKDEDTTKKLQIYDAPESVKSENSHEESITKTQKKAKKGRRFRRAMPEGKPVKDLFSLKSCYHPGCGGHDNARLLIEKSVA